MKDLLKDQEKETGKEMKLKSTQVIFFSESSNRMHWQRKVKTDMRHQSLYSPIGKDFRIKGYSAIFCGERWLVCLDGLW